MPDKLRAFPVLRPAPTKLRPPAMGFPFVPRSRLLERVRAQTARLAFVQAPAGFGKTTFLRHVFDSFKADGWTVAWLTVDSGDNDLDRFMTCLGQAFIEAKQEASDALDEKAEGYLNPDDQSHPLTFELSATLAAISGPFMLILDEFEQLHNPAVLSVIEQVVDMLRPEQRIVIGSREQPMLSVGRLRVQRQLLEIDAAQLRFNMDETDSLLRTKRGLALDGQDVERLHHMTGGWAAALWLSSLALEDNDDPKRFISNFSGNNTVVASYLAEDVLSHKPRHVQDFILQTSILQKFCIESCNAVTGRNDSGLLLAELERSNMFVTALDEQHVWFAYHPLFAGFLRGQLERQSPGLAATLHRRAALWHIDQKRPIPAIDHALASGDRTLALDLLQRHAEALFLQGRVRLLVRWFDAVDRGTLKEYPKLASVYAWSLIHSNRSEEALSLIDAIAPVIPSSAEATPIGTPAEKRPGTSLSHPTYVVLKTFSLVMLDRIEQTAPMWADPHILCTAASEPLLRSMLMIGCAYFHATANRFQEARVLLDQATREQPSVGPLFSITVGAYVHAMLDLMQGRLRAAVARLRALIGDASPVMLRETGPGLKSMIAGQEKPNARYGADSGFASLYLAETYYEADALEEAKRLLKLYLPLVKDAGIPDQLIASHVLFARILHHQGHATDAMHILLDLEQLGMQRRLMRISDMARLERARQAVLDGNALVARDLLTLVGESPSWMSPQVQMIASDIENPTLSHFRWQIHFGSPHAVLSAIKEHLHEAQARGRVRYALRVKVLYALALHFASQRNPALRTVKEAMQEALQEGFVRVFREEGPVLLNLVRELYGSADTEARDQGLSVQFMRQVLGETRAAPAGNTAQLMSVQTVVSLSQVTDSELTSRELDVLRLLAKGCGNQAIAEKLFVSVTTIKTHLRNINAKLGAHNRTEAISIARTRSIID
jgi:LuxR family transcriptional regulator, maltose regulon positive regulatory protein